jgi:hypothetical protein
MPHIGRNHPKRDGKAKQHEPAAAEPETHQVPGNRAFYSDDLSFWLCFDNYGLK